MEPDRIRFELDAAKEVGRYEVEGWRIKKDGTRLWANVVVTPISDDNGSLIGFSKVLRDITERKLLEDRLKESEEKFRLLVEGVRDYAIFMLNPEGFITSWNAGAQRIKGYRAEEIIGKHFSVFYPEEDLKKDKPGMELRVATETGRFEDEGGWRLRKDGSRFWANVVITAIRNPQGTLLGFTKVTRDLTEKKIAEDSLRDSEERYRLMIENVKDYAIFMLTPQGYVASWNLGAQRLKGYRPEEIIGKHFTKFYTKSDLDKNKPDLELKVAAESGRFEDEGWRVRKDGSLFWANVIITAIRTKDGKLIGFTKVTRDLTERKNAEESMKKIKLELENTVDQLSQSVNALHAEVTLRKKVEEELVEKNQQLNASNQDLEQFAYVASHDLKEPLRMIGSYSAILIRKCEGDDPAIKEYSDFIMDGVSHMQALINGLLDYSRVGRKDIRFEKVDMRELIYNVEAALGKLIESSGATIDVKNAPVIAGVPSLVATLLQNLIANGVKFRRENARPHIIIDAVPAKDSRHWLFSVKDNGIGIPKQYYNRIFALFQRLHTRQQYEGTGIGLAISKRIVDFHKGELWVESELNKGSTFYFTLPVVEMLDSDEMVNATQDPAVSAVGE